MSKLTADTITDEQIREARDLHPEGFSSEACADALGMPPGPYDNQRSPEEMERERVFQRGVAAAILSARAKVGAP